MDVTNLKDACMDKTDRNLKYRALLGILLDNIPDIKKIEGCDSDGYITFSVLIKDLGLTKVKYFEYRKEFLDFCANILAELLVRENLNRFLNILTEIDSDNYMEVVNKRNHTKFGLNINNTEISFRFHASLLQRIIADDFKMQIKNLIQDSAGKEV